MRLGLVGLTHPFRGGIAHYTTLLCQALRQRHEVEFFALSRQYPKLLFPGTTQRDLSDAPLAVEHRPCLDSINPWSWVTTGLAVRRFAPELLLFSWWHPFFAPAFGTVARTASRGGRTPSCYLCHNVLPHESSRVDRWLSRYAFSSGSAFITHSEEDARKLRQLQPGARVATNPHPTYEVFRPESRGPGRDDLGLAGKRVVLFFGFVRAYKGLDVLLDAFAQLPAERGYHLLLVGEFYEDRAKYEAALDRLAGHRQLTLVDCYVPNEDVPGFFEAADLVAVPYHSATQSGIVQMAYAFGIPVVATRVGGLPEVVDHGRTGLLVPPGNPGALADAIHQFFEREDLAVYAEQIARRQEDFSWDRMVETIERVASDLGPGAGQ